MRPDDPHMKHSSLFIPQRPSDPAVVSGTATTSRSQQATADLTRTQIDNIYQNDPHATMAAPGKPADDPISSATAQSHSHEATSAATAESIQGVEVVTPNPYDRVHNDQAATKLSHEWQQYHSAWQNYYQQYFQRYYAGHLQQTQSALASETAKSQALEVKTKQLESRPREMTREEAANDLRAQLRQKVASRATKIKKSRHFYPILAASLVMLVFLFLQYNRNLFAYIEAYIMPRTSIPDNIIVDPTSTVAVSEDPRIIIPKLSLDVPAIYDNTMGKTNKETYDKQMAAMAKGVAWFGVPKANSKPGQIGNTVLAGHSSSEWFDNGDYKFIFARLEQLQNDDTIYLNYKSVRYTYKVTQMRVVAPNDVAALQVDTDKPLLTLITCVPIGTANSRLLVTAEQISPDPAKAQPAPSASSSDNTALPGQTPTFVDRLFGN